jgi:hypothetical protein
MSGLHERVRAAQRLQFLRRVNQESRGDTRREVLLGEIGTELGLPYEVSLEIASDLAGGDLLALSAELEPPAGPRGRITRTGIEYLHDRQAA